MFQEFARKRTSHLIYHQQLSRTLSAHVSIVLIGIAVGDGMDVTLALILSAFSR